MAVLAEVGMQNDVEEAALAARRYLRDAGNRLFEQAAVLEEAQAPRPLGDQQPAVGQEGEAPGMVEAGAQGLDAEVLLLRALARERKSAVWGKSGEGRVNH